MTEKVRQAILPPARVRPQDDLGVRLRAPAVITEGGTQSAEVVDLAVERDQRRTVGAGHWLAAGGREVDDREPVVPEPHPGAARFHDDLLASAVGSAMVLTLDHSTEHGAEVGWL